MTHSDVIIREMTAADRAVWADMRFALWPEDPLDAHAEALDALLADPDVWGFIAEALDGAPAGFVEIAIRKYANGCDTQPVSFVEGIWVAPQFRRRGVGAKLIAHAEAFLLARGFRELGSDTEFHNGESQAAHQAWGFAETERVVYFRKLLTPRGG